MSFIIYSIHCLPQAACFCSVGSILFCCKAALVLDDSVLFISKYIQIGVFDKDTTYLHLVEQISGKIVGLTIKASKPPKL